MEINKGITEIKNEIELLDELFESHKPLVEKIKTLLPNQIERSAAATLLHSFYNGIENIFKRIAHRIDGKVPTSEYWHQELLNQMGAITKKRDKVISIEMLEKLNLYLGFRHFFRHSYAFQCQWDKMKDLISEINDDYIQFKEEINVFIKNLEG